MENETFGTRLKRILDEKAIDRKALAHDAGISVQAVGNYINDNRKPDCEVTAKIAKALDISADYLLNLSQTKSTDKNIQSACAVTGLSEAAITKLQEWHEWPEHYMILSKLITDSTFDEFLHNVRSYLMLANNINSVENEEIRQLKEMDQNRAMEYLGTHNCSGLTTAFLALKSNLDAADISKFYLSSAQEEITAAIKRLSPIVSQK